MLSMGNNRPILFTTRILLAALLLLLALTILVQANPGTRVPARDYGFYVYIGDQIVDGKLPYRDAWESKPPAIFYVNAVGLWLGRGSRWGVWTIELIALLAAGAISFATLRRLWGIWPALFGLILWHIGLDLTLQGGNLTEEYPLVLHFLSIALFLKLIEMPGQRLFNLLLGLAFGINFLFRPNNAVLEAAIILILVLTQFFRPDVKSMLQQILFVFIGMLTPLLVTIIYFWSQGLVRELFEASILYNLTYSTTAITSGSPLLVGFRIFGWIAWVVAAGYLVAFQRAFKAGGPVYLLLLIGWPMVIYLSDPAKRSYAHYFINWLPLVGLFGGLIANILTERLPAKIKDSSASALAALAAALLLAGIFFFTSGRASEYQKAIARVSNRASIGSDVRTRTAAYVQNHTRPDDLVLFWAAAPGENFMSDRESPSAYLFYPLYVHSAISQRMNDQFLQDIMTKRPILIVDIDDNESLSLDAEKRAMQIAAGFAWEYPPDNLQKFFIFVEENYYLEAKLGERTVYRLDHP